MISQSCRFVAGGSWEAKALRKKKSSLQGRRDIVKAGTRVLQSYQDSVLVTQRHLSWSHLLQVPRPLWRPGPEFGSQHPQKKPGMEIIRGSLGLTGQLV